MNLAMQAEKIKEEVAGMLGMDLGGYAFEYVAFDGAYVCVKGDKAIIGGNQKPDFYRAFMLMILELKKEKKEFEITNKRNFKELVAFIDVARNAVLKVSKLKEIIDLIALLGFNSLQLYLEDVFELPGYPHFGYRRGRYTHEELKEIDDYAYAKGIEVVANIEVLGHLEQYLRYAEADAFKESKSVLKCGDPKTYAFVECMIQTMRKCFRSNKINILCDEAGTVGVAQMLEQKRYISSYDIAMTHLNKVVELCKKHGFTELELSGDFFYHHLGKGYYDFEFAPDREECLKIPDVNICYWDYYHTEYAEYETLLKGHRALGKEVSFSGAAWTWCGQLPNIDFTFETMEPALKCCLDYGVKRVTANTFGDDGNETNIALALPAYLIFSEHCFRGTDYTTECVYEMCREIFKIDMEKLRILSNYHYPWCKYLEKRAYIWPVFMGKRIFYTDVLYNLADTYEFSEVLPKHREALAALENYGAGTPFEKHFDYARLIFEITIEKMELLSEIRRAYKENDRAWLTQAAEVVLPSLAEKYHALMLLHEQQWFASYKVFGWEELNARYGGTIEKMEYAKRRIQGYLSGEYDALPELEYEFIDQPSGKYNFGGAYWYELLKSCGNRYPS